MMRPALLALAALAGIFGAGAHVLPLAIEIMLMRTGRLLWASGFVNFPLADVYPMIVEQPVQLNFDGMQNTKQDGS